MKRQTTYLPATLHALDALGAQIASARRDLGWTAADLAERLGTSRALVGRIEHGAPTTTIGVVIEAAVICGVPLFGADSGDLARVADRERARVALLPGRIRRRETEIDDDF